MFGMGTGVTLPLSPPEICTIGGGKLKNPYPLFAHWNGEPTAYRHLEICAIGGRLRPPRKLVPRRALTPTSEILHWRFAN